MFKCNICSKEFESERSYSGHKSSHSRSNSSYKINRKKEVPIKINIVKELNSCKYCGKIMEKRNQLSGHTINCKVKLDLEYDIKFNTCKYCNKSFPRRNQLSGHITLCPMNPSSKDTINKLSEALKLSIKEGRSKGWTSRNILSYPEKFFIEVLKNNNLFHLCETNYYKGGYFLDFYFPKLNLDIEIDGAQHLYRKEHDIKRDNYLESEGILVHRIPWKSINTNEGKDYITKEITMFLDLFKKISFV